MGWGCVGPGQAGADGHNLNPTPSPAPSPSFQPGGGGGHTRRERKGRGWVRWAVERVRAPRPTLMAKIRFAIRGNWRCCSWRKHTDPDIT